MAVLLNPTLESLAEIVADVCQQVAELKALVVVRKKPTNHGGRLMTRPDRAPYGWTPNPKNPRKLIEDEREQTIIRKMIGFRQDPALSLRQIGQHLDLQGYKRRGGGRWIDAPALIQTVLRRHGATTPADARKAVQRLIEAQRARR
jgi:hypothetical protein